MPAVQGRIDGLAQTAVPALEGSIKALGEPSMPAVVASVDYLSTAVNKQIEAFKGLNSQILACNGKIGTLQTDVTTGASDTNVRLTELRTDRQAHADALASSLQAHDSAVDDGLSSVRTDMQTQAEAVNGSVDALKTSVETQAGTFSSNLDALQSSMQAQVTALNNRLGSVRESL